MDLAAPVGLHPAQGYHLTKPVPADDLRAWLYDSIEAGPAKSATA